MNENASPVYQAVMRCPSCQSSDTCMHLETGKVLRDGEPFTVNVVWTCRTCRNEFKPNDQTERSPILMCDRCREPRPHHFVRIEDRTPQEPSPRDRLLGFHHPLPIHDAIFACDCGSERIWGNS